MRSQQTLAAALGIPPARVGLLPWARWLPAGEDIPTDYAWADDGARAALTDTLEYAVQDRRGFLTLTGALLTSVAGGWVGAETAVAKISRITAGSMKRFWPGSTRRSPRRMDDLLGGEVSISQSVESPIGSSLALCGVSDAQLLVERVAQDDLEAVEAFVNRFASMPSIVADPPTPRGARLGAVSVKEPPSQDAKLPGPGRGASSVPTTDSAH
jgi:hypothetical protein